MAPCVTVADGKSILVTGGAGYIGSHACKCLASLGYFPVSYDNLSDGNRSAVRWGPLVVADIGDSQTLSDVIRRYCISTVIHFAAYAYVGESIINPRKYFENNLVKTISLLNTMLECGVREIIFSSSCSTYGIPVQQTLIDENQPQVPINPYGESKLVIEKILRSYGDAYGLKWISLRYFNAAGADPDGEIGECHKVETHLIPLALQSAKPGGKPLHVFGSDYPTPDGTAIRDYVHVTDLAKAHVLAIDYLRKHKGSCAFNLGTGKGHSVKQVLEAIERVTTLAPVSVLCERRAGDAPMLIADPRLARKELDWATEHSDISNIVRTAWHWLECQTKALPASSRSILSRAALTN